MSLIKLLTSLVGKRQEPPVKTVAKANSQWISNPWHAVSVAPGEHACALARGETEVRYLSKDAPQLPLKGCELTTCTCRYRHYEDRRTSRRRAADLWSNGRVWAGQERRRSGRRSVDSP